MQDEIVSSSRFLTDGGEMGRLIQSFDWSATHLGNFEQWTQSLKTSINIMLRSGYPMFIWWGRELIMLHNDAYLPVLGKKHPQALGQSARMMWSEIWEQISPMVDSVFKGQQVFEKELLMFLSRKGFLEETYWTFSYSPILDDDGTIGGLFCACQEETENILRQRRLKSLRDISNIVFENRSSTQVAQEAAANLQENAKDIPFLLFYLLDETHQRAHLINQANWKHDTTELLVLPLQENLHQCLQNSIVNLQPSVLQDLDAIFPGIAAIGTAQHLQQAVVLPLQKSGEEKLEGFILCGISPHLAFEEEYKSYFALVATQVSSAIAQVKAFEAERKRTEALLEIDRLKTAFFSNVSHEFRTPLTLMLSPLQEAIAEKKEDSSKEKARLELIYRNAKRLHKLVNTLLDFSRIEAGRIQAIYHPTDLAALTIDLASSFRSAIEYAGLRYEVNIAELSEPVYVDRDMWEKIVLNLLSNAYKFTFEGKISISLQQKSDVVEFVVADTGIGISEKELPNIFSRFYRVENVEGRTHEGSGIGLSLVQELVQLHGGSVSVQSEYKKGSTFVITIPLGKAHLPAEKISTTPALESTAIGADAFVEELQRWIPPKKELQIPTVTKEPLNGNQAYVLIADDNADMRHYLEHLLSPFYHVLTVNDGESALAAIQQDLPALILADIMMPRMDGLELLSALRGDSKTQDLPVILVSARAGEEARVQGIAAGADDYLVKPFNSQELLAVVKTNLNNARLRKEINDQLKFERQKLADLLLQAPMSVGIWRGPNFIVELANEKYLQLIDKKAEDVVGKPLFESSPELSAQGLPELLNHILKTGETFYGKEYAIELIKNSKKEISYHSFIFKPFWESDSSIAGIMATGYEVTEMVLARKKIEESEQRYRALIQALPAAVYTCDAQGYIELYNEAAVNLWGRTPIIGEDLWCGSWKIYRPDGTPLPLEQCPMAKFLRGESLIEGEEIIIEKPNGVKRHILPYPSPIFDASGNRAGAINMLVDITEIKQIEQSLRASEERYRAFVSQSSEAIWRFELEKPLDTKLPSDQQIEYFYKYAYLAECNDTIAKMYGYEKAEEIIGIRLGDMVPASDPANINYLQSFIESGYRLTEAESNEVDRDGQPRYFLNNLIGIVENGILLRAWGTQRDITERKQTEAALRNSENQLRLVTNALPVLISYVDKDHHYQFVNHRYTQWFGIEQDQIVGMHVRDVLGEEAYQKVLPNIEKVLSGQEIKIEQLLHYKNVGYKYVSVNYIPNIAEDGEVKGWYALVQDITERKQADVALRQTKTLIELSYEPIFIWDLDKGIIEWNIGAEQTYGYTRTEAIGRVSHDLLQTVHPLNLTALITILESDGFWTGEIQHTTKDGRKILIESRHQLIQTESGKLVLEMNRDITKRKADEQKLIESEARFRNMADHAPVMIWVTESNGACTYLSQSWYDFTGQTPETGLNFGWLNAIHPDDQAFSEAIFSNANKKPEPFRLEYRLRRKDGQYRWAIDSAQPRFSSEGEFLGYIGSVIDITERKAVEEKLKQREQELHILANTIPQLAWMAQPDGYIFWYNERWYEYTGTTLEQMQGWGWQSVHTPDLLPQVIEQWKHSIATGSPFEMEFPLRGADGIFRWFLTRIIPLIDSQGKIIRWFGTNTDINELRRMREAIAENERHLQHLANAMPQVVWIADPQGAVYYYNNRAKELAGIKQTSTNQWEWQPTVHPEDITNTMLAWEKAVLEKTTYSYEHRLCMKDGNYRWHLSRAFPIKDTNGTLSRWYGTATDIDDLKRTQQALTESKRQFQDLADTAPVLIWQSDLNKEFYYFNRGWLDFTGRTLEQEQGKGWTEGIHPEDFDRCLDIYATAFDKRETFVIEYRLRYHDGTYRWIYDRGVPTYDEKCNFTGYLGGCIDIQEKKEAEEQKDAFIRIAGHELRTPLTSMLGYLNLIQNNPQDTELINSYLQKCFVSALKMRGLINDFLYFSKSKSEQFSYRILEFDFDKLIAETVENLKLSYPKYHIRLSGKTGKTVVGDRSRIEQVISNLLNNAIKYSPEDPRVEVRLSKTSDKVVLQIKDYGIGIEPADIDKIFNRFYRAGNTGRIKGMGLGLFIVKQVIDYHNGSISVESQPGIGTMFTIELPLHTPKPLTTDN